MSENVQHYFLYISNNHSPELIEKVFLEKNISFDLFSNNVYLYSSDKHKYSSRFIPLYEVVLLDILDEFETNNIDFNSEYFTGSLAETIYSFD